MLASNTVALDGRKTTPAELMAACDSVPFLAQHRLVVVDGLLSRLAGTGRGRKPSAQAEAWLALADYVARMPPSSHLVLLDGDVKAAHPLLKALKGKGEIVEFRPLNRREVPGWIQARARALELKLTPPAARLLAEFVGNNRWALAGELDKLSVFAGDRPVTDDDVRALVPAVREVSIFPLVDAIVEGRPTAALRMLRQMLRQGSSPLYVLSMVQRQLRHLAVAREMQDAGSAGRAIGETVRVSGFPLDKLLEQAARYPPERIRSAFARLLEADLQVKRGVYQDELALELLVHDLAAASPATAV